MDSQGQGLAPLLVQGLTPLSGTLMTFCAGPSQTHALRAQNESVKGCRTGIKYGYKVVFDATFYCARSLKTPVLRLGQALQRILYASVTQREEAPRKSCLAGCSLFGDISGVDEQGAKPSIKISVVPGAGTSCAQALAKVNPAVSSPVVLR